MAVASRARAVPATTAMRARRLSRRTVFYIMIVVTILANLFPFYWMVVTSLKSWAGIFTYPPTFLPLPLDTTAYREVFEKSRLAVWLYNSVAIGVPTTLLAVIAATSGAYALSRFNFRGRGLTGMLILVTQMLPGTLLVIPIYLMFKAAGLLDTHIALIVSYATFALPFSIWMLKGYFDTIPIELEEAALVDGCTRLRVLRHIVLPLSLPGLTVTAMFAFVLAWNDLVLAITLNSNPELRTVAVGLASFVGEYGTPWGQIMAASAVSSLPILLLFLFLQRYLLYGLTAGAVKG
ncbi:MAG: carbohydrate ABC transporter permease [Chloroflexi bacterium]|nr:carbohydrate ABC transporter permease [Chloroflexota bacterium]